MTVIAILGLCLACGSITGGATMAYIFDKERAALRQGQEVLTGRADALYLEVVRLKARDEDRERLAAWMREALLNLGERQPPPPLPAHVAPAEVPPNPTLERS